jgi:hypothetical protein
MQPLILNMEPLHALLDAFTSLREIFRDAIASLVRFVVADKEFQVYLLHRGEVSLAYTFAGCPYGNNRKGKKRWALEMKRK